MDKFFSGLVGMGCGILLSGFFWIDPAYKEIKGLKSEMGLPIEFNHLPNGNYTITRTFGDPNGSAFVTRDLTTGHHDSSPFYVIGLKDTPEGTLIVVNNKAFK